MEKWLAPLVRWIGDRASQNIHTNSENEMVEVDTGNEENTRNDNNWKWIIPIITSLGPDLIKALGEGYNKGRETRKAKAETEKAKAETEKAKMELEIEKLKAELANRGGSV